MTRVLTMSNAALFERASFTRSLDWSFIDGETVEIRFHERYNFIQPWFLAALAAWATRARALGMTFRVINADRARWAWRMHLHDYLGIPNPTVQDEHAEEGRFLSLRQIQGAAEEQRVQQDMLPLFHFPERNWMQALQYVISEVLKNVREHAQSPEGAFVCAQYYANGKPHPYVQIGVADLGIGTAASLRNSRGALSDAESVVAAVTPGVSGAFTGTYSGSDNAGMGLSVTRRLAAVSERYFGIWSGEAHFRSSNAAKPLTDARLVRTAPPFPGTIVAAEFALTGDHDFGDVLASITSWMRSNRAESTEPGPSPMFV